MDFTQQQLAKFAKTEDISIEKGIDDLSAKKNLDVAVVWA